MNTMKPGVFTAQRDVMISFVRRVVSDLDRMGPNDRVSKYLSLPNNFQLRCIVELEEDTSGNIWLDAFGPSHHVGVMTPEGVRDINLDEQDLTEFAEAAVDAFIWGTIKKMFNDNITLETDGSELGNLKMVEEINKLYPDLEIEFIPDGYNYYLRDTLGTTIKAITKMDKTPKTEVLFGTYCPTDSNDSINTLSGFDDDQPSAQSEEYNSWSFEVQNMAIDDLAWVYMKGWMDIPDHVVLKEEEEE
ncbi:hypothetical protein PQC07_gp256 [Aeromonas phage D3]|uniref:Uncharacterized protein n=1 Tax=Aeromonas phage D3 TaxID=2593327 RepID=A0A514TVG1_9CAUD|nr:hypothetical protein PQC07_gp256 [Aeromonas phage D3]QDJ97018.1 hypothetical protein D3_0019 [Aeromonas phage D3]QEP52324.1 hypothetical protein D9_0117 [Aeromonas phage D9]